MQYFRTLRGAEGDVITDTRTTLRVMGRHNNGGQDGVRTPNPMPWSPMKPAIGLIALFFLLLVTAGMPRAGASEEGYRMGVFPYFSPTRLLAP